MCSAANILRSTHTSCICVGMAANALSMLPDERAWLRDPAAHAAAPPVPPYRPDPVRAASSAAPDGDDAREGDDEEDMQAEEAGAVTDGDAAATEVDDALRAELQSCIDSLPTNRVRLFIAVSVRLRRLRFQPPGSQHRWH